MKAVTLFQLASESVTQPICLKTSILSESMNELNQSLQNETPPVLLRELNIYRITLFNSVMILFFTGIKTSTLLNVTLE